MAVGDDADATDVHRGSIFRFGVHLDPEDGASMYLWNVGIIAHDKMVLHSNNRINTNTSFNISGIKFFLIT